MTLAPIAVRPAIRRASLRSQPRPRASSIDSTNARIPSKQIQTKPSKNPWICLDLFVRIGTFQRVMSKKIKKIDSRLKLCAKRLRRMRHSFLLAARRPDRADRESIARNSDFRKKNVDGPRTFRGGGRCGACTGARSDLTAGSRRPHGPEANPAIAIERHSRPTLTDNHRRGHFGP